MTVQVDLMVVVIIVLLVIIAAVLVPMLVQVRNTMQHVDEFVREAQRDLLPMLRELREASERVNRAAANVEQGSGRVGDLLESLGEVGDSIHSVNSLVQGGVGRSLGSMTSVWSGFRAAAKAIRTQLSKHK